MNKLLQIKPGKLLMIHLALIVLSILISILWTKLVPEFLEIFGITFALIGIIGGYLFWIYLILTGFKNIDFKNGLKSNLKKFKILLSGILIVYVVWVLLFMSETSDTKENITFIATNVSSIFLMYAFIEVIVELTKKFRFYEEKPRPNLWNYFVTLMTLGFYPFGLLMMHSHLQMIMKDQKIIEDKLKN